MPRSENWQLKLVKLSPITLDCDWKQLIVYVATEPWCGELITFDFFYLNCGVERKSKVNFAIIM